MPSLNERSSNSLTARNEEKVLDLKKSYVKMGNFKPEGQSFTKHTFQMQKIVPEQIKETQS